MAPGSRVSLVHAAVVVVATPTGVDVELLAHAINPPLQVAVLNLRNEVEALALQIQIAGDQTTKMRGMSNPGTTPEGEEQRHSTKDHHEVAGLHREYEEDEEGSGREVE